MTIGSEHIYFGRRLIAVSMVCVWVFGVLLVRLWYLQCFMGAGFRHKSENNRTRTITTAAPRGAIYDREGRVLVRNRPAFNVALMLEDIPDKEEVLTALAEVTEQETKDLLKRLTSIGRRRPFEPKILMSDVSRVELAKIKANSYRLPGVIIDAVPTRQYPYGESASQLFGYVREISREQLGSNWGGGAYSSGDMVGQSGLEKVWERTLRGDKGYVRVEVDARGNRRGELEIVDNRSGKELVLTLDLDLQRAAEKAFAGRKGALVGIDPRNGEVLVMLSSPSFDANIFSGHVDSKEWAKVSRHKDKPLNNRAIASRYPPGSTLKLMLAVAGLAEKVISIKTEVPCPGYYNFGRRRYHCHKRSGHGEVDLIKAIRESCNSYFYQLGEKLGVEKIHRYAKLFGLGEKTGIQLPGEERGIVPSRKWKLQQYGERWYPGDTIPIAIGQGYMSTTPLQMGVAMATLANGKKRYRPFIVKKVIYPDTGEEKVTTPEVVAELGEVNPRFLEIVRRAALEVVNHPKGTGKKAALEGVSIGGKTGTAQVARLGREEEGEQFRDHAWFVAFAPEKEASLALAVVVEHAGHGGVAAAPIAQAVYKTYFEKKGMEFPELEETPAVDENQVVGAQGEEAVGSAGAGGTVASTSEERSPSTEGQA